LKKRQTGRVGAVEAEFFNGLLKSGPQDKRCKVEARMKGRDPLTVSHDAEELQQAIDGAMNKLTNALDRNLGKDAKRWTH